jgi:hypothetical protein
MRNRSKFIYFKRKRYIIGLKVSEDVLGLDIKPPTPLKFSDHSFESWDTSTIPSLTVKSIVAEPHHFYAAPAPAAPAPAPTLLNSKAKFLKRTKV